MLTALLAAVILATPTPTITPMAPPTPPFPPLGPPGSALISAEQRVAAFRWGTSGYTLAATVANYGVWSLHDLATEPPKLLAKGQYPEHTAYIVLFDPVLLVRETMSAPRLDAILCARSAAGPSRVLNWQSYEGLVWRDAVEVFESGPPEWPDKPWGAVSTSSSRRWLVWNMYDNEAGRFPGRCVATSEDGVAWSDCYDGAPGQGPAFPLIATTGPESAIVFWGNPEMHTRDCTASGLAITCAPPVTLGPWSEAPPPMPELRAPSHPMMVAHEELGEVALVWSTLVLDKARLVWRRRVQGAWLPAELVVADLAAPEQFMPTIATYGATDYVVTYYERQAPAHMLRQRAVQWMAAAGRWVDLGYVGALVDTTKLGWRNFLGDYEGAHCEDELCAAAFVGDHEPTPCAPGNVHCPEIRVHRVAPVQSGCQVGGNYAADSSALYLGALLLGLWRRRACAGVRVGVGDTRAH